jgi:haloacid dehalogenase superfamily, subfamily IA, variant 3 with third motif having DD or ED/haloacid dehalogenase superfamily, subfamily IA, variant 1 with third motif having Dx(3-4)D or Dx(3-4)E
MNKPKAILFDLDDTILAYSNASMLAWEKCCDEFVLHNEVDFSNTELFEAVTKTRKWYWSDSIRNKIGRADMKNARREVFRYTLETFSFKNEHKIFETADSYSQMQESLWKLFDDLPEAFDILQKNKIRMAIVTNGKSDIQREKIKRFDINKYFEYVIIDTDVGVSKPDTEIYQIALNKLSLSPDDIWMIGDNLIWDVKAPQELGIFSVWNDFEKKGLPKDSDVVPDMIVCSIKEMVNIMANQCNFYL